MKTARDSETVSRGEMMNSIRSTQQNSSHSAPRLTPRSLKQQNRRFKGLGGVSAENRSSGFVPAFSDTGTGAVYLSRFADGRLAPFHLLEGLPAELVLERSDNGRVNAVKKTVQAGFVRGGEFYTRAQAAAAVAH